MKYDYVEILVLITLYLCAALVIIYATITLYNRHSIYLMEKRSISFCQTMHDVYNVPTDECIGLYNQER
jgi:hypothetical protein